MVPKEVDCIQTTSDFFFFKRLIFVDRKRSHSQLDTCVRAPNCVFSVIAVQLLFSVVLVVAAAAAFVAAAFYFC